MAESRISDAVESLLKPIRDRPLSSLVFFLALAAGGPYARQWIPEKPEALQVTLLTLVLGTPATGIVLAQANCFA